MKAIYLISRNNVVSAIEILLTLTASPLLEREILGGFNLDILVAGLLLILATLSANARERDQVPGFPTPFLAHLELFFHAKLSDSLFTMSQKKV